MAAPAADQTGPGLPSGQQAPEDAEDQPGAAATTAADPTTTADSTTAAESTTATGKTTTAGTTTATESTAGTDPTAGTSTSVSLPGWFIAVVENALIVAGLLLLAFGQQHQVIGDGLARYQALVELMEQRHLSEMPYSLIGPIFAAPLWAIGQLRGDPQGWTVYYNALLFTLALGALHLLLRDRMDPRLLRRFLLILVAGSMIAPHVLDFYGEVFTATTVGVGLLAATLPGTSRLTRAAGWVGVVLGVANTPASLVGLGLVAAVLAVRQRRLRYLLVLPVTAAVIMGEAWLRHGDPFHSSYIGNAGGPTVMPYSGLPGFSYPFLLGLLAILFSFGKGLVWFVPGLFLPVRRRLRAAAGSAAGDLWSIWLLWTVFVAGLVLVYARWWAWYGGMYWGPRFFLIAILPASLALALWLAPARSDPPRLGGALITFGVLVLAMWGAANSLVYGQLWPWKCYENNYYLEGLCHFTPEYSALWYPFVVNPELNTTQQVALTFYGVVLLWLAVPLMIRIGRQAGAALRAQRHLLAPTDWRW